MKETNLSGNVFGIQYFSVHDGPGIRTSVFFKGCDMNCIWCHNPEGISFGIERHNFGVDEPRLLGWQMSCKEILSGVFRDKKYYENSGGGLTVSGGEPMCQFEFLKSILTEAKRNGLHTALETNGNADIDKYREIAPLVDLFLVDFKIDNEQIHKAMTGISNKKIKENLRLIPAFCKKIIIRCPVIPGINDNPEHFKAIAYWSNSHEDILGFEVMPYHKLGISKAKKIGRPYKEFHMPDKNEAESYLNKILAFGGKKWEPECF